MTEAADTAAEAPRTDTEGPVASPPGRTPTTGSKCPSSACATSRSRSARRATNPRAVFALVDPGSEVPVHHHPSDYCSLVVEGSVEVTRKLHEVGSVGM